MFWQLWLSGHPLALAEAPVAVPEEIAMGRVQKASVEGSEIMIDRLCRAAAEEDRQPHPPSLELSLVQQPGPGERENRHCRRAISSTRETSPPLWARHGSR